MTTPSTRISRLSEKQSISRDQLDELLDSTPLATVALVRDGHPVIFPTGFARVDDELVIHGSTGSPWMRACRRPRRPPSRYHVDGIVVARSGFESSFRYRSAVMFGVFERVPGRRQSRLSGSADRLVHPGPGRRTAGQHPQGTRGDNAAAVADRADNWSLKVSAGWPEDPDEDIAGDAWAGVVPMSVAYGAPVPAPDLRPGIPLPESVRSMTGAPPSVQ